jgi:hypothetical protein
MLYIVVNLEKKIINLGLNILLRRKFLFSTKLNYAKFLEEIE